MITVFRSAVFLNWLVLRKTIVGEFGHRNSVVLDMTNTRFVDHSVMEKLHELEQEFHSQGKKLELVGLDNHKKLSSHPLAARWKPAATPEHAATMPS